jgi:hypothetical protein
LLVTIDIFLHCVKQVGCEQFFASMAISIRLIVMSFFQVQVLAHVGSIA